jgi:hypothetical protein
MTLAFSQDGAVATADSHALPPSNANRDATSAGSLSPQRRRVLMMSSNGTGQGHITRQLAAAQRMKVKRPVFLTMSYAATVVRDAGFPVQFVAHHHATGEDPVPWNVRLGQEIDLLFQHIDAESFVYDVGFVYDGVIQSLTQREYIRAIWIRRALWPAHHASYLGAKVHFHDVVEPGDLAETLDDGPTVAERNKVWRVPPVLRTDPETRLTREQARAALGLSPEETVIVVDLAGSSEAGFAEARDTIIAALLSRPGVKVVELSSALVVKHRGLPRRPGHISMSLNPAFHYSRAFDGAVARAGYNTFHESLLGAIPTLFIPSEGPDMDRQILRAQFAAERGLGLLLRIGEIAAELKRATDALLDPARRADMVTACSALTWEGKPWRNGAEAIARLIDTGNVDGGGTP